MPGDAHDRATVSPSAVYSLASLISIRYALAPAAAVPETPAGWDCVFVDGHLSECGNTVASPGIEPSPHECGRLWSAAGARHHSQRVDHGRGGSSRRSAATRALWTATVRAVTMTTRSIDQNEQIGPLSPRRRIREMAGCVG